MPLVGYSPWEDAAQYGRGLADTLGQIFLGLPKQRFEMAQARAEAPLQQQLLQAQVAEAQAKPELAREMQMFRQEGLDERLRHDEAMEQYEQNSLQERVGAQSRKGVPSEAQTTSQANAALNQYASNLANKMGVDTKQTPVTIDPNLSLQVIDAAMKGRSATNNPEMDSLQHLVKLAPLLAPLLSTNLEPKVTSGRSLMHPFTGSVTNMVPQVTTNGFSLQAPLQAQAQSQAQASAPLAPPQVTAVNAQGQRIGLVNGKWVPIQ